jgi:uncharacterized protein
MAGTLLLSLGGIAAPGLTLLIDDLGHGIDPGLEAQILALPPEVGVSILPGTPRAADWARACAEQGREYLAHLPWQPLHSGLPAERALMPLEATSAVLYTLLLEARDELPDLLGANNHQGSRASLDPGFLDAFAIAWRPFGLPFVDSRTIGGSRVAERLGAAGVPVIENRLFIDHHDDTDAIGRCLDEAFALGRRQAVLVIGHPRPRTLAVLADRLARLPDGLRLQPLSAILPSVPAPADWLARAEAVEPAGGAPPALED